MPSRPEDPRQLLQQLAEQGDTVPFSQLYAFSDLSGEDLVAFRAAWPTFPTEQRRRLMRALVELAEASFQVSFDAIFRHCLDDDDNEVRAAAIEGLWENEETALIGPLLTMLRSDPSVRVRTAGASALGRYVLAGELEQLEPPIQARIITELLTTIYLVGESVEVRRRALESVAYACSQEVLAAIEMAYYDDDDQMRLSAIVGMGRSCDQRWRDIILEELENTSPAMRYEAALASGELRLRQAVPILARLLEDADLQVRHASIWALGQIGGTQAKELLLADYDLADADTRAALEDALAEQALAEGDLDFVLYEIEGDPDDFLDDELYTLWTADDEATDQSDQDTWEPDPN
jgi:HEAT repeat protein